tara:strand:+ start:207 stop:1196 length:990 start_codon:yes stop_codon:yes gene_type:complete
MRVFVLLATLVSLGVSHGLMAHEIRPAYLALTEEPDDSLHVLWKLPQRGTATLGLQPTFPDFCQQVGAPSVSRVDGAVLKTFRMACSRTIRGSMIGVAGLDSTLTDVLVRYQSIDGGSFVGRLLPDAARLVIPEKHMAVDIGLMYFGLGVEHILFGFDHLLFVLMLLMLTTSTRVLIYTITAFTVAHSITLAFATFELIPLDQTQVEILIALSLVVMAREVAKQRNRQVTISDRNPWLIAFVFGLIHGFGFAGALTQIGLPANHVPLSLLVFNLGVEAGQLLFVGLVLFISSFARKVMNEKTRNKLIVTISYGVGMISVYWTLGRFYWV